jgi:hypothetical protein
VLFSSEPIAAFINTHFEPCWESVRPVPLVTIDFGNGSKLTRTLNGNIATYVCSPDGRVLDILPGVYTPDAYLRQLEQLALLSRYAQARTSDESAQRLKEYHQRQAALLEKNEPPAQFIESTGVSISGVEKSIRLIVGGRSNRAINRVHSQQKVTAANSVANWKELAEDTRINETLHRRAIHAELAKLGPVPPSKITKWLYREVLHADLDDPMLGVGKLLEKNYPFAAAKR